MKINRFVLPVVTLVTTITLVSITAASRAQNPAQSLQNAVSAATITKDPKDTTKMTWKTGGLFNLTFNQAALSNWAAGGDKSAISLNTLLNLYAYYANGKVSWDNFMTSAYGFASTTSIGTRKTADNIDLTSRYGYDLGKKWFLSALFDFRTQ